MKKLFVLFLLLSSCAKINRPDVYAFGTENRFKQTLKESFGGAQETSLLNIGGEIVVFFDPTSTGLMNKKIMSTDATKNVMPNGARFNSVTQHDGVLYAFVTRDERRLMRLESRDEGETWTNETLVIQAETSEASDLYQIWNSSVAVDSRGVWHMLLEASDSTPFQRNVGLSYATSPDGLSWTRPTRVIEGGGNPFIVATSRGLLAFHGLAFRPNEVFNEAWHTTASTFDGTTWTTHESKFNLGNRGVHICDPTAVEKDGKIILAVSVDQNSNTLLEADDSFESLHERLTK